MIKIERNVNFPQWWNIRMDGIVIDNTKRMAHALEIADKLRAKNRKPIIISK